MKRPEPKNRVSTPMIITAMVMILLFFGFVALLSLQRQNVPTYDTVRKEQRLKNLADLNSDNQKIMTQYHWVDKAKGVVGIPIDRAMDLVLTELQSIRPHAGPASDGSWSSRNRRARTSPTARSLASCRRASAARDGF